MITIVTNSSGDEIQIFYYTNTTGQWSYTNNLAGTYILLPAPKWYERDVHFGKYWIPLWLVLGVAAAISTAFLAGAIAGRATGSGKDT